MNFRLLIIVLLLTIVSTSKGQDYYSIKNSNARSITEKASLGFGLGYEYAGTGMMFSFYPTKYFGLSMSYGITKRGEKTRKDFVRIFIHDWTHATSFSAKFRFIPKNAKNYFRPYIQGSWGSIGTEYTNRYSYGFEHSNILASSLAIGADVTINNHYGLIGSASISKAFPDEKYDIEHEVLYLSFGLKIKLK
jgi:hypothetical protein